MWNGLMVDARCWEPRHPQEFVRGRPETHIEWVSPEPTDIEVNPYLYVDVEYWDNPAIVPPAVFIVDQYCEPG